MRAHPPEHQQEQPHPHFNVSRALTGLLVGTALVGAAVIVAPHLLPAIGLGSADMAAESMFMLHNSAGGSGLAGAINGVISAIPLIGGKLAEGGLFNAAATGIVGIGGVLLGNFIEKKQNGKTGIKWGNVIKYGALATSALFAMPTVLTALGAGLIFLSTLMENAALSSSVVGMVDKTIGSLGSAGDTFLGLSGVTAAIPHFLVCGMSVLPTLLSFGLIKPKCTHKTPAPEAQLPQNTHMEIALQCAPEQGKLCEATLTLRRADGTPIDAQELATVHEAKLHLFITDSSLQDYQHVHPHPTGKPGEFAFSFTPRTPGNYSAWADITTAADGKQHLLKTALPKTAQHSPAPNIRPSTKSEASGLHANLRLSEPLEKGQASLAEFTLTDASGNPVRDLEPVMGAYAHLVGFNASGNSLLHAHPMGAEPQSSSDRGGPNLRFHVVPEESGPTQMFLQLRRGGEDVFLPFGQRVKLPTRHSEKLQGEKLHEGHAHTHAMAR